VQIKLPLWTDDSMLFEAVQNAHTHAKFCVMMQDAGALTTHLYRGASRFVLSVSCWPSLAT
jgi:hypothetical protein